MKSIELKKSIAKKLDIPASVMSVNSSPTYISVRIRPVPATRWDAPLVYTAEFPAEFRRACLAAIYGEAFVSTPLASSRRFCAGNVSPNLISMPICNWVEVLR
jgi:hypothetical protein